jgi:protein-disulfide isomerase
MNRNRNQLWLLAVLLPLAIAGAVALSLQAHAQSNSALKPPLGAKVAIVVFEDLQCPDCARAHQLLEEAARTYKIPLVRHDFPLPMHPWSFDAAVLGRYFDTKSNKLGSAFRDYVFEHQAEITKENLRATAEKFAKEHNTTLPFAADPRGKLTGEVNADKDLATRIGIDHTPTIYVVTNGHTTPPFVEVVDRADLFRIIDTLRAEAQ